MIALDWQCSNSPGRVSPHCKDLTIKSSLWLTITPSVRCSDAAGANPEWRVNNRTDNTNLATLRLMGPGFAVISINWHRVEAESVELQCLTPACRLTGRLRRARPSSTTSTSTTSRPTTASTRGEAELVIYNWSLPAAATTTRRGGLIFSSSQPSSARTECRARGRWRGRPGVDQWCNTNCNRLNPHCPPAVCSCWAQ